MWEQVKFSEIVESPPKIALKKGDLFSFIPMEIINPNQKYTCPIESKIYTGGGAKFGDGDIIFARITPCLENGKIAKVKNLSNGIGFGSTEYLVFRAKKDILDPDFLFYLAISPQIKDHAIKSMTGSSGRQRARKEVIDNLMISIPHYNKQIKIGSILSVYDNLIENNRRRIQLLEWAARLIYEEWFVKFRFPGYEKIKIINGIPEGWDFLSVKDIFDINPGMKTNKKFDEITFVPMNCLSTTGMTIDLFGIEKRSKYSGVKFKNNDVLFARITPCLENGKTGFVQFLKQHEIACGSTEFIVLRAKLTSPEYVYCLARTENFRESAIKSMIGSSGRQRVQPSFFENYHVAFPPKHLLSIFENKIAHFFRQISVLDLANKKLTEARDLLLPKLINGEMVV